MAYTCIKCLADTDNDNDVCDLCHEEGLRDMGVYHCRECRSLTENTDLICDECLIDDAFSTRKQAAANDLFQALSEIEGRVRIARGHLHNAQEWDAEGTFDGDRSLWDWIFAPTRAALAKAGNP